MPNNREIITIVLILISSIGIIDMSYRWKRGRVLKKLKKIKNKTRLADIYIERYKHFFEFMWWHWLSVVVFFLSVVRIVFDSD